VGDSKRHLCPISTTLQIHKIKGYRNNPIALIFN